MDATREQWILVITAACAECSTCGGSGYMERTHRRHRWRGNRRVERPPITRHVPCLGCKYLRFMLEELGVPARRVMPERVSIRHEAA